MRIGRRIVVMGIGRRMNATAAKTMKTVIWIANPYVVIGHLVGLRVGNGVVMIMIASMMSAPPIVMITMIVWDGVWVIIMTVMTATVYAMVTAPRKVVIGPAVAAVIGMTANSVTGIALAAISMTATSVRGTALAARIGMMIVSRVIGIVPAGPAMIARSVIGTAPAVIAMIARSVIGIAPVVISMIARSVIGPIPVGRTRQFANSTRGILRRYWATYTIPARAMRT
jgi:hypothetical protein